MHRIKICLLFFLLLLNEWFLDFQGKTKERLWPKKHKWESTLASSLMKFKADWTIVGGKLVSGERYKRHLVLWTTPNTPWWLEMVCCWWCWGSGCSFASIGSSGPGWFSWNCQLKDHPPRDGSGVGRGSQGDILGWVFKLSWNKPSDLGWICTLDTIYTLCTIFFTFYTLCTLFAQQAGQLYVGSLLWLVIFCQISPGIAFKWTAR